MFQNFFYQNYCLDKKKISAKIIFGDQIFFRINIFFHTKIVFWKFFFDQILPKIFCRQNIFSDQHIFWDKHFFLDQNLLGLKKFEGGRVKNFWGRRAKFGVIALWSIWSLHTESWPHTKPRTLQKVFGRWWVVHSEFSVLKLWTKAEH